MSKQVLRAFAGLVCLLSSASVCVATTQNTCNLNGVTVTDPNFCSLGGTFSDGSTYGVFSRIGSVANGGLSAFVSVDDFTTLQYFAPEYHGPPPDPRLPPFLASASAVYDVSDEFSSTGGKRLGMLEFQIASRLGRFDGVDVNYWGTGGTITVTDGVHSYQSGCSGNFCSSLIGPIYLGIPLVVEISQAQMLTVAQQNQSKIYGTLVAEFGGNLLLTEQDGTPVEAFLIPEPGTLGVVGLGVALLSLSRTSFNRRRRKF